MFGVEWLNTDFLYRRKNERMSKRLKRIGEIALIDRQTGKKRCLPLYAIPDRTDGKSSINTFKGLNNYTKRMNRRYKKWTAKSLKPPAANLRTSSLPTISSTSASIQLNETLEIHKKDLFDLDGKQYTVYDFHTDGTIEDGGILYLTCRRVAGGDN